MSDKYGTYGIKNGNLNESDIDEDLM